MHKIIFCLKIDNIHRDRYWVIYGSLWNVAIKAWQVREADTFLEGRRCYKNPKHADLFSPYILGST